MRSKYTVVMVRTQLLLALIALLAAPLAGCVGGGEGSQAGGPDAPADVDDETGAVAGIITDSEARPVAGVTVALIGAEDIQSTTDEAGSFTLSNVPPGTYTLAVQKLGFESVAKSVNVVAGQTTDVQVTLEAIAVKEPYMETWADKGYFECSWSIYFARGPCFFPGPQVLTDNNKRAFNYMVNEGAMTVIVEMSWEQTTAATGDAMSMFLSYTDRTTSHWYCHGESPSPVFMEWERDDPDDEEGECLTGSSQTPSDEPQGVPLEGQELTARANTGRNNDLPGSDIGFGLGAAFQQSFEVYFSNFYWEYAPEDYTGIPDQ